MIVGFKVIFYYIFFVIYHLCKL